jgi:hypothetical protein
VSDSRYLHLVTMGKVDCQVPAQSNNSTSKRQWNSHLQLEYNYYQGESNDSDNAKHETLNRKLALPV